MDEDDTSEIDIDPATNGRSSSQKLHTFVGLSDDAY